jgi:hypothetical protein
MFLYFGGCSYTEGSGLADHEIFPDIYPGNYSDYKLAENIRDSWVDTRFDIIKKDNELFNNLTIKNNNKAYPAKIGKLLNANVMNGGIGGNSIFGILVKTIHDLTELIKTNNIPDHVFIGLTTTGRIPIINTNTLAKENNPRNWIHTLTASHLVKAGEKFEKYAQEYWKSHTDEQMLTTYLYYCFSIKNYVKNITGKDPIFLNVAFGHGSYLTAANSNLPILKEIWNLLEFNKLSHHQNLTSFATHSINRYVADGHWNEDAHDNFANHVVEKFLTNN